MYLYGSPVINLLYFSQNSFTGLSFEGTNAATPPAVAPRHSSASADFYREAGKPEEGELEAGEDEEDAEADLEEDVPSPPRTFTKAKPLPERENKFTSTLRRLSTVRKRNKTKRKSAAAKEKESNGESGIEPGTHACTPSDLRPSSTTSRESEGEVLTSGYFRYIL